MQINFIPEVTPLRMAFASFASAHLKYCWQHPAAAFAAPETESTGFPSPRPRWAAASPPSAPQLIHVAPRLVQGPGLLGAVVIFPWHFWDDLDGVFIIVELRTLAMPFGLGAFVAAKRRSLCWQHRFEPGWYREAESPEQQR